MTADVYLCKGHCCIKLSTITENLKGIYSMLFEENREVAKTKNLEYIGTRNDDNNMICNIFILLWHIVDHLDRKISFHAVSI